MWVIVHFDLPTETKEDRKNYSIFRKLLLQDGFKMIQYSMYVRHSSSRENSLVHKSRVKAFLPPHGQIIVFELTDAQFAMMEFYHGRKPTKSKNPPIKQLELF